MNFTKLPKRSSSSIVQQMNCASTKQIFKDFYSGKPIDLPAGSDNRSFDFDDQTSVDFDQDFFRDADNLIDQHFMQHRVVDSFKVSPAPVPAPASDPAPDPAPAPAPAFSRPHTDSAHTPMLHGCGSNHPPAD